jgi:hypothetical protein
MTDITRDCLVSMNNDRHRRNGVAEARPTPSGLTGQVLELSSANVYTGRAERFGKPGPSVRARGQGAASRRRRSGAPLPSTATKLPSTRCDMGYPRTSILESPSIRPVPSRCPFRTFVGDDHFAMADVFTGAAASRGVYLHPWHNWFLSAAHTDDDIDTALGDRRRLRGRAPVIRRVLTSRSAGESGVPWRFGHMRASRLVLGGARILGVHRVALRHVMRGDRPRLTAVAGTLSSVGTHRAAATRRPKSSSESCPYPACSNLRWRNANSRRHSCRNSPRSTSKALRLLRRSSSDPITRSHLVRMRTRCPSDSTSHTVAKVFEGQ